MASPFTPTTPIPTPKSGIDKKDLMDFASTLVITLPKNTNLNKITVYIAATGEPAQGYIGKPLVQHCKEWTTVKSTDEVLEKLQGLLHLRILFCAASQSLNQNWSEFQYSDEYLYGLDQSKISIYKAPSRGAKYLDQTLWNKVTNKADINSALQSNKKVNKGVSVEVTFTTMAKKVMDSDSLPSESKEETVSVTSKKMMDWNERNEDRTLTQSQIEYLQKMMREEQNKLNKSVSNKGKREWKWKLNEKQKKREASEKYKREKATKDKKERAMKGKMGGGDGVQTKYAHFDMTEEEKRDYYERELAGVKQKENSDGMNENVPKGSEDINSYSKGQIVHVWSQKKCEWIDGEVIENIKFIKTIKVNYSEGTKQFRIPNVNLVRLKV